MKFFSKVKASMRSISTRLMAPAMTVLASSPALAADGFQRANTIMEKISLGLHGLAAITITVAVVWVGYKTLWVGDSLRQCAYIIIGGILIGGGSEIGALLMG
ncbi:TrbC/VirB2 family protein [Serratia marcescens]